MAKISQQSLANFGTICRTLHMLKKLHAHIHCSNHVKNHNYIHKNLRLAPACMLNRWLFMPFFFAGPPHQFPRRTQSRQNIPLATSFEILRRGRKKERNFFPVFFVPIFFFSRLLLASSSPPPSPPSQLFITGCHV